MAVIYFHVGYKMHEPLPVIFLAQSFFFLTLQTRNEINGCAFNKTAFFLLKLCSGFCFKMEDYGSCA